MDFNDPTYKGRPPLMMKVPTLIGRLNPEGAEQADREETAKISGQPTRPENPFIGSILRAVRKRNDL